MGIILQNVEIFLGWGQVGIFDRQSGDSQPESSGNTENINSPEPQNCQEFSFFIIFLLACVRKNTHLQIPN